MTPDERAALLERHRARMAEPGYDEANAAFDRYLECDEPEVWAWIQRRRAEVAAERGE